MGTENLMLAGMFVKTFPSKTQKDENGQPKVITYVEIWLTDFERKAVYKVKPFNTENFIATVLPKAQEFIGKYVSPIYEEKFIDNEMKSCVVDILPVKRTE